MGRKGARNAKPVSALPLTALVVVLLAAVPCAQGSHSLTNDDIMEMVRAGLSTDIVLETIESVVDIHFDLSPRALVALKTAGVANEVIEAMQAEAGARENEAGSAVSVPVPEKSDLLIGSRDPEVVLRHFRTMLVDASQASFFGSDQMKAALREEDDFERLGITLVDDPSVADVVLEVGYTFAWDYPFSLRHQNTSVVLLSGKGSGPFSGPAGAASVASELANLLKAYRVVTGLKTGR